MRENDNYKEPIPEKKTGEPAINPLINNIFGKALINQNILSQ